MVTINGKTYHGNNVVIMNGKVIIDGKEVDEANSKEIKVIVEGNLTSLRVDYGSAEVHGNVTGNVDAGGSIKCGDVGENVDAGGSVQCGNVRGDVDAGGSVQCGDVEGDVDAGGSVIRR